MSYINKQQMTAILKDAQAKGADPKGVIQGLVKKGHVIEGVNSVREEPTKSIGKMTDYQTSDIVKSQPAEKQASTALKLAQTGAISDDSPLSWVKKAMGKLIGDNSITRKLRTGAESLGKSVLGAAAGAVAEIPKAAGNISNVMNPISGQFAKAQGDALGNQIASLAPQGTETAQKVGGSLAQLAALFAIPEGKVSELTGLASKIPEGATALQYLMKGADLLGNATVQATGYEAVDKGQLPSAGEVGGFAAFDVATKGAASTLKNSSSFLFKQAERLYQSALKPSTAQGAKEKIPSILKTGINEGIALTEAGKTKLAEKITTYEQQLDDAITAAGKDNKMIPTDPLKEYIKDVKSMFGNTVDVEGGKKAVQEIDDLYDGFIKKYGTEISVGEAQQLKVNTYKFIKKSYDKLSSSSIEAQKQLARGLKEGVVDAVPQVKGINEKLKALYEFEQAFEKAHSRIGNWNIFGLGSTGVGVASFVGTGSLGTGAALAGITKLLSSPSVKSQGAIYANKLGNLLNQLPKQDQIQVFKRFPVLNTIQDPAIIKIKGELFDDEDFID